ncbi:MAG TPA: cation transporter [Actinopolymorphaceae bacterium]
MGHGHAHGPGGPVAAHPGAQHRWRLAAAFALDAGFCVVESVFGLLSGSLALLSDAGHMAADVVTVGLRCSPSAWLPGRTPLVAEPTGPTGRRSSPRVLPYS